MALQNPAHYASPEDASRAFCDAFGQGDVAAMMAVWADDDEIFCIHPGGPRLTGLAEIRHSWGLIFTDSLPRSFSLRGRVIMGDEQQRIHLLEENIRVPGTTFVAPPVLATNVYRRSAAGWRMVLHHASVAPHSLHLEDAASAAAA